MPICDLLYVTPFLQDNKDICKFFCVFKYEKAGKFAAFIDPAIFFNAHNN